MLEANRSGKVVVKRLKWNSGQARGIESGSTYASPPKPHWNPPIGHLEHTYYPHLFSEGQAMHYEHIIFSFIIYPTCIDPSDKHNNLQMTYVQTLAKSRKVSSRNSFVWKISLRRF
jgi:hypothetical protein